MKNEFYIHDFVSKGFRGIPKKQKFTFQKNKKSMVIFSLNGRGKSSFVDGFDCAFSLDGTVSYLNKIPDLKNYRGGQSALKNLSSSKNEIDPSIGIKINANKKLICHTNDNPGTPSEMSEEYLTFLSGFKVSPIIRGRELLEFLIGKSPEELYEYFANSIQLGSELGILNEKRVYLGTLISEKTELEKDLQDIISNLNQVTELELESWNEAELVKYLNDKLLSVLGHEFKVTDLASIGKCLKKLESKLIIRNQKIITIQAINSGIPRLSEVCPVCNQHLTEEAQKHLNDKKNQMKNQYEEVYSNVKNLYSLYFDFDMSTKNLEDREIQIEFLSKDIRSDSKLIRNKIRKTLKKVETEMKQYFKIIQGDTKRDFDVQIKLGAKITNKERLLFPFKFKSSDSKLHPNAFLSESQVHTLIVAFHLANIKELNSNRIVILDDILTSNDADSRRRITGLIIEEFQNYQVFVTTHDELFIDYFQDMCNPNKWKYMCIIPSGPNNEPKFISYKSPEQIIEELWRNERLASPYIRKVVEKWLKKICEKLNLSPYSDVNRNKNVPMSKYAEALQSYFKDKKLKLPKVYGVERDIFDSVRRALIENFGSHDSDKRYGNITIGDEQSRWIELDIIMQYFECDIEKCDIASKLKNFNDTDMKCLDCGREFRE